MLINEGIRSSRSFGKMRGLGGWLSGLGLGWRGGGQVGPSLHKPGWQLGRHRTVQVKRLLLGNVMAHSIFAAEYHRKRLFAEPLDRLLHVAPFEDRADGPQVSAPERAMLELLSEVGVRQPIQEARELMESAYNLRADVLRELLKCCTNVKTVRLCLQLGREFSLPWIEKLDPRNYQPAANGPGCRVPLTAYWCSNHEPNLSRYGKTADTGRAHSLGMLFR